MIALEEKFLVNILYRPASEILNDVDIKKYCVLTKEAQNILDISITKFVLSFRAINKVLKVSRTIADLNAKELIDTSHIIEALSYRKR